MSNAAELEEQTQSIELSIESAKKTMQRAEALARLGNNRDFIDLITEGYFKEEPARLAILKASPSMRDVDSQAAVVKGLDSIGALWMYFNTVEAFGEQARSAIASDEQELEVIANEARELGTEGSI